MRSLFTIGVAVVLLAGCGKSEAERQAEQAAADMKKAADTMAQAQEQGGAAAAKGMAEMATAMQGMAAALGGDGKVVEPVSTDALKGALPAPSGWTMDDPRTERMTSPIAYAQVETDYRKGDTEIAVKVVDSGFAQLLIAPWSMFLTSGFSRETSDGYEKAVTVAGHPGFESWDKDGRRGELNLVVAKRFLVTLEGRDLADTKPLHDFAAQMDLGKLAGLK